MQTTLRLEERLLGAAKRAALARGQSLNQFILGAVGEKLARAPQKAARRPIRLATFRGKGLQPGVNLDDSRTLLDRLEGRT